VLRIAKNKVERLNHGWYVVKNYLIREICNSIIIEECHIWERDFFARTVPWTELPRDHISIENVKHFLAGLLYCYI
jgi:hypothetical protein